MIRHINGEIMDRCRTGIERVEQNCRQETYQKIFWNSPFTVVWNVKTIMKIELLDVGTI